MKYPTKQSLSDIAALPNFESLGTLFDSCTKMNDLIL